MEFCLRNTDVSFHKSSLNLKFKVTGDISYFWGPYLFDYFFFDQLFPCNVQIKSVYCSM